MGRLLAVLALAAGCRRPGPAATIKAVGDIIPAPGFSAAGAPR